MELDDLVRAQVPIVEVVNSDPLHVIELVTFLTGVKPIQLEINNIDHSPNFTGKRVYISSTVKLTNGLYRDIERNNSTLIYLTAAATGSPLVYAYGELEAPPSAISSFLKVDLNIAKELKGLTVTQAKVITRVLRERGAEALTPQNCARLSTELYAPMNGLYLVDPDSNYTYPEELQEWVALNLPILKNDVPALRPRGLLLKGGAGTGKTSFAKKLGAELGWNIFRLDVASSLQKYLGESEQTVRQHLQSIAKMTPCILLIDEVEKVFSGEDATGAVTRILSYLLWWLSEHNDRVFTIMTSNDISSVPPELYRAGRIDEVLTLTAMSKNEAILFAEKWLHENYLVISPKGRARLRSMMSTEGETPIQAITYAKEVAKWERLSND